MGIRDIQFLHEVERVSAEIRREQAEREETLMAEHRKGLHPFGRMRRECPLCLAGFSEGEHGR